MAGGEAKTADHVGGAGKRLHGVEGLAGGAGQDHKRGQGNVVVQGVQAQAQDRDEVLGAEVGAIVVGVGHAVEVALLDAQGGPQGLAAQGGHEALQGEFKLADGVVLV